MLANSKVDLVQLDSAYQKYQYDDDYLQMKETLVKGYS